MTMPTVGTEIATPEKPKKSWGRNPNRKADWCDFHYKVMPPVHQFIVDLVSHHPPNKNEHYPTSSELVSIDELARLSKQHVDMINLMVDWGLIEPSITDPQPLFFETTVPIIWKNGLPKQ